MTRPPLPALLLVAVLAAGCTTAGGAIGTPSPTAPSSPSPTTTPTTAEPEPIAASWAQGAPDTELPDGWVLRDCEGDAPIVCVHRGDELVGTLAFASFPPDGPLVGATDGAEVVEALRAHGTMRMQGLVDDRAIGCGEDYVGSVDDHVDLLVGGQPGVRSGFTAVQAGELAEHVVTYATISEGQLWLLVAEAAAEGTCMGDSELELFAPADLDAFLPILDRVVAGTPPLVDDAPAG